MKQRVMLVALIVAMGVIAVVQIVRTHSVAQATPRLRFEVKAAANAPPAPAHAIQTDGQ